MTPVNSDSGSGQQSTPVQTPAVTAPVQTTDTPSGQKSINDIIKSFVSSQTAGQTQQVQQAQTDSGTVPITEPAGAVADSTSTDDIPALTFDDSDQTDIRIASTTNDSTAATSTVDETVPTDVQELSNDERVKKYLETPFVKKVYANHRQLSELKTKLNGVIPTADEIIEANNQAAQYRAITEDIVTGSEEGATRLVDLIFGPVRRDDGSIDVDIEGNRKYYPAAEKVVSALTANLEKYNPAAFTGLITNIASNPVHIERVLHEFSARVGSGDPVVQELGKQLISSFQEDNLNRLVALHDAVKSPERKAELATAIRVQQDLMKGTANTAKSQPINIEESEAFKRLKAENDLLKQNQNKQLTEQQQNTLRQRQSEGVQALNSIKTDIDHAFKTLSRMLATDELKTLLGPSISAHQLAVETDIKKQITASPVYTQQILPLLKQYVSSGDQSILTRVRTIVQSNFRPLVQNKYKDLAAQFKQVITRTTQSAKQAHESIQGRTGPGQTVGSTGVIQQAATQSAGSNGRRSVQEIVKSVAASLTAGNQ